MVDLIRLSVCAQRLAIGAGAVVRNICASGDLRMVDKSHSEQSTLEVSPPSQIEPPSATQNDDFDPQTEADRQAQHLIIGGFRHHFPGLTVIGEEDQEDSEVSSQICSGNFLDDQHKHIDMKQWPIELQRAALEDVCVWVDPVDGTKSLASGDYDNVTVLIGIAVKGKAAIGVIHSPFSDRTVFGAPGYGLRDSHERIQTTQKPASGIVITSWSHFDESLSAYLAALDPAPNSIIRSGGCGAKMLMLLDGKADAYLYPRSGTKKWDSCAGDAILTSAGGRVSDKYGVSITYDATEEPMNADGIICTYGEDVKHEQYIVQKQCD